VDSLKTFDQLTPIFICGFPKSGTTLTLSLLDSHPDFLVMPEETRFFGDLLPMIRKGVKREKILESIYQDTGVKHFRIGASETTDIGLVDYPQIQFDQYKQALENYWKIDGYSEAGLLKALLLAYRDVSGQVNQSFRYWVEKTPLNELYIDKMLKLFPKAQFVYILRDPRANFYSYSKTLTKRIDPDFNIHTFLSDWSGSLLCAVTCQKRFHGSSKNRFIFMTYEMLTADPKQMMQMLVKTFNSSWDNILLQPTRAGIPWQGNSMHGFQFEQVSSQGVAYWKDKLSEKDVRQIESCIGRRVFNSFGWPLSFEAKKNPMNLCKVLASVLTARNMPWYRKVIFFIRLIQLRLAGLPIK